MKNLLNVKGAQALTKNEQKTVNGGMLTVSTRTNCAVVCLTKPAGYVCESGHCIRTICDGNGGVING